MHEEEIRSLVARLDTKDSASRDATWEQLRPLGERVLPFFEEFFPHAKRLEARRDMAFHSIRYARTSDTAFRIGLKAIADRSTIVRYRGCCILAYSLRRDALPLLQPLMRNSDTKTVDDAGAAIDAIQNNNHHFFIDRQHTGQAFWDVCPGDIPSGH
jgi:HEAT repeat protein